MSTLTKEWLLKTIAELEEERDAVPGAVNEDAAMALAAMKLALASLEAEPAIHRWRRVTVEPYGPYPWHYGTFIGFSKPVEGIEDEYYYSAPPAPVSVLDITALDNLAGEMLNHAMNCERRVAVAYTHCAHRLAEEVRDLRAAMLQGAENAESTTTMQTKPALDSSPKIAESTSGNSTVIPDGWVAVPVEPTEDMIVNGFESEPDESFSDEKEWEVYEAMSGCQQAAHRAKLCWAAMISAAPKI
ncbi:hypothetical protein [Enterobacter hormaechei]|uniref:hypothetical protein n=1 Tax=Enterobacter hormaechei TaxID=158836 RepID=UPI0039C3BC6C